MSVTATAQPGPATGGLAVPQHSLSRSIALHLLPGVPGLIAYAIASAFLSARGLPNIFALYVAIVFAEVPVLWAVMIQQGRKEQGRLDWKSLLPFRSPLPIWQYVVIGVPLILFSVIMTGAVAPAMGPALRGALFAWVPDWFVMEFSPQLFSQLSRSTLILMWVFGFVSTVVLGGPTQEIYFRGFLLPRMETLGRWGPGLNALLFAVFHLVSPWSWPAFFIMVLPWAYLVRWKKSLRLGVFIHVGMLFVQSLLMALVVFGLVPLPQ